MMVQRLTLIAALLLASAVLAACGQAWAVTWTPTDGVHVLKAQPTSAGVLELCFFVTTDPNQPAPLGCSAPSSDGIGRLSVTLECGDHQIRAIARNALGDSVFSDEGTAQGVPCPPFLVP